MTRHFKSCVFAGAALAGMAAFSAPASAVVMKAVHEGTVFASFDQFDLFGQGGGTSLNGLSYTLTFVYDAATPDAARTTTGDYDRVRGGAASSLGAVSPMLSATLAILGHSEAFDPYFFGYAENFNNSSGVGFSAYGYHRVLNNFNADTTGISDYVNAIAYDSSHAVPTNLDTPYGIAATLLNEVDPGYFQFVHYDFAAGQNTTYTFGRLNPTRLTVTRVEEVPLPAALPMLVAGLGALGLMARKRRKLKIPLPA